MQYVGQRIRRQRDERILRGQGEYIGDIQKPGMVHLAFVRSPYAHARIIDIDTNACRRIPGVIAVFTGEDVTCGPLPLLFPYPSLEAVTQTPLSREVHHVGEPVAVVVALTRYQAEDGVAAVQVQYDPLAAVVGMGQALELTAPPVHSHRTSNRAATIVQCVGTAQAVMDEAPVVVELEMAMGRVSCLPIETRGLLAQWQVFHGQEILQVYAATQTPHMMQRLYAQLFNISEQQIRVQAPDVGGAFGAKEPFYVEDFLVAWVARQMGRPVLWIEDRAEHLMTAVHERAQHHKAAMGLTRDGKILSVVDQFVADTGAYVPWGVIVPIITSTLIPGPYKVPHYRCDGTVVYTNTTPLAPYRGAGRPQAALVINRLLDKAAAQLNLDPFTIRRRNLIMPEEFPYDTGLLSREGTPMVLDSGNYPALMETLEQAGEYHGWRERQRTTLSTAHPIGIGIAVGIENTGMGPHEGATVTIGLDGNITVATGAASQGQGHETTLAQIAADIFHVSVDQVHIVEGDTAAIAYGTGTFASRTAVVAGSAVQLAGEMLQQKLLRLAGHLLEAHPDDLVVAGGSVSVRGVPTRSLTFKDLALRASGPFPGSTFTLPVEPGLSASAFFTPSGATYAAGAHMAVVQIDRETGQIRVIGYTAVHDSGTLINPQIVDGQLHGGIAAGLGTALLEEMVFDEQGQVVTGTLMDYLVPTAVDVPDLTVCHLSTPSPLNPLGIKGVGESGAIASPAALLAAIEDALRMTPVVESLPVRPMTVRHLLTESRKGEEFA